MCFYTYLIPLTLNWPPSSTVRGTFLMLTLVVAVLATPNVNCQPSLNSLWQMMVQCQKQIWICIGVLPFKFNVYTNTNFDWCKQMLNNNWASNIDEIYITEYFWRITSSWNFLDYSRMLFNSHFVCPGSSTTIINDWAINETFYKIVAGLWKIIIKCINKWSTEIWKCNEI